MNPYLIFVVTSLVFATSTKSTATEIILSCKRADVGGIIDGVPWGARVYLRLSERFLRADTVEHSTDLNAWKDWCSDESLKINNQMAFCETSYETIEASTTKEAKRLVVDSQWKLQKWPAKLLNVEATPWVKKVFVSGTVNFSSGKSLLKFSGKGPNGEMMVSDTEGKTVKRANWKSYESQCEFFQ
ncbi:hypothetical protein PVV74_04350 [Roseovarius sp. SK2]|uniref:hypothetical protein n=1 Tax=Roseovarius TaxID=74030 RepID=UPI00237C059A|nr:hypothetical protein [Roseovarius sp. SK2]MDD9724679.1 hypothetical protein [Roseovarius sp. SK2]